MFFPLRALILLQGLCQCFSNASMCTCVHARVSLSRCTLLASSDASQKRFTCKSFVLDWFVWSTPGIDSLHVFIRCVQVTLRNFTHMLQRLSLGPRSVPGLLYEDSTVRMSIHNNSAYRYSSLLSILKVVCLLLLLRNFSLSLLRADCSLYSSLTSFPLTHTRI